MRSWTRNSLMSIVLLGMAASSAVAQSRIQLVQGRRIVENKVTFVVEIAHEKNESSRYAEAPEDIQIYIAFGAQPATGIVYLDGKALGRFDETMAFNSNPVDITYGRHRITVEAPNGAVVGGLYVTVRGGRLREVLDDTEVPAATALNLQQRVVELERRVQQLESRMTAFQKNQKR